MDNNKSVFAIIGEGKSISTLSEFISKSTSSEIPTINIGEDYSIPKNVDRLFLYCERERLWQKKTKN